MFAALLLFLRTSEGQKTAGGKKNPTLCDQYPSKSEGKELKIVVQPETQHRARYLTEGSRGSVKDRTQQGFPTVKVFQIWGGEGGAGAESKLCCPGVIMDDNLVCLPDRACIAPASFMSFPTVVKLYRVYHVFQY